MKKLLRRRRQTATQTHLDAESRQRNVSGAFSLSRGRLCQGLSFLLVDDVITTGATLNACAKGAQGRGRGLGGGAGRVPP